MAGYFWAESVRAPQQPSSAAAMLEERASEAPPPPASQAAGPVVLPAKVKVALPAGDNSSYVSICIIAKGEPLGNYVRWLLGRHNERAVWQGKHNRAHCLSALLQAGLSMLALLKLVACPHLRPPFLAPASDEHCDIREWVLHHASIGVGKIYLFDTQSDIPMQPVLDDLIASGLVGACPLARAATVAGCPHCFF